MGLFSTLRKRKVLLMKEYKKSLNGVQRDPFYICTSSLLNISVKRSHSTLLHLVLRPVSASEQCVLLALQWQSGQWGASLVEGSNFPFLAKLLVRGCPRNKVWRIPGYDFNLSPILCLDLEHLRKTDALLMGSFRLRGVILECGPPGLPFPGGIWSTAGPTTGAMAQSPSVL